MAARPVLALSALLALLLAGCSGGSSSGVVPQQDSQGRYVIHMTDDLRFVPAEARVPLGATIVWVNDSAVDHDVNAFHGSDEQPTFSSSLEPPHGDGLSLGPGTEYPHAMEKAGKWTIWCHRHHEEDMQATVHVG